MGTRAPGLLQTREMWGISYLPLVDVLIDMAWSCVHQNLIRHLSGVELYPKSNFGECLELLVALTKLLCGTDRDPAEISMGIKFMDLTQEEPVPRTYIINHDCQHHGPGITFNADGHTAVQTVSKRQVLKCNERENCRVRTESAPYGVLNSVLVFI